MDTTTASALSGPRILTFILLAYAFLVSSVPSLVIIGRIVDHDSNELSHKTHK